jgi:hypothetical protein
MSATAVGLMIEAHTTTLRTGTHFRAATFTRQKQGVPSVRNSYC